MVAWIAVLLVMLAIRLGLTVARLFIKRAETDFFFSSRRLVYSFLFELDNAVQWNTI
jgi:hypothetical protein